MDFFVFLKLSFYVKFVATFDLMHDVEAIFHLSKLLTGSGNLF